MKLEQLSPRHQIEARRTISETWGNAITAPPAASPASDDPESALHDYILEYAHKRGWLAIHSRMDRRTTTARGVSDFILITPKTVLFVECKRKGNKPTDEQRAFLAAVRVLGWPGTVVWSKEEFELFMEGKA